MVNWMQEKLSTVHRTLRRNREQFKAIGALEFDLQKGTILILLLQDSRNRLLGILPMHWSCRRYHFYPFNPITSFRFPTEC